jgi:hypothetical protein
VLDRVSKVSLAMAVSVAMTVLAMPGRAQTPTEPAQKSPWKDRAEYDLYGAIVKEQNPAKKLELLNSWKEKYPATEFKADRDMFYVITYAQANQAQKTLDAAKDAFAEPPKEPTLLYVNALYYTVLAARGAPTPDNFSIGEKAANSLLNVGKPTDVKEEDWNKAKTNIFADAHATLGWIALQKKEFAECLKLNPNYAQVSFWLGTAIVAEKKPEKQSAALFHFARAASLDPSQGGLPAASRQPIETYFVNAYNRFHGQDPQGLQKLRDMAKAQPFPPDDFKIENVEEVKAKNEEEFKKKNPSLALWLNLKQALVAADGEQYFNTNMKGAEVPGGAGGVQTFKGKLISSKPALHPKELVLSIGDGTTPDATLTVDAALPGKADPGVEIEFSGAPASFTKDPFNITFDVEKKKVVGWPGKDAPVRHHTAAKKKG